MLSSKITSWFFLGYLVLLLNFGSSLHHAPIFGLHSHIHHHTIGDSKAHSSCCCDSDFHSDTLIPSLAPVGSAFPEPSDDASSGFSIADHNCAFCKFFDEYNVVVASFECDLIVSPFSLFLSDLPDGASAQRVPSIARGPPTA